MKKLIILFAFTTLIISCKRDVAEVSPIAGRWDVRSLIISDCDESSNNAEYICPGGGCDIVTFSTRKIRLNGVDYNYTVVGDKLHVEISPSIIFIVEWSLVGQVLTLIIKDGPAEGGCTWTYTYFRT